MNMHGFPISFCLEDVPSPAALTDLIHSYFGRVTQEPGPHTVVLVPDLDPNEEVTVLPKYNTFSVRYVEDCTRQFKLLPLRNYWVNKAGEFDDVKFDPFRVMLRQYTWDECAKRTLVPECESPASPRPARDLFPIGFPLGSPWPVPSPPSASSPALSSVDELSPIPGPSGLSGLVDSSESLSSSFEGSWCLLSDSEDTLNLSDGACDLPSPDDQTRNTPSPGGELKHTPSPGGSSRHTPTPSEQSSPEIVFESFTEPGVKDEHSPSPGEQDEAMDALDETFFNDAPATCQPARGLHRARRPYSHTEQIAILTYIHNKGLEGFVKGNKIWKVMEAKNICPGRTWQSLKENYRRQITRHLEVFPKKLTRGLLLP